MTKRLFLFATALFFLDPAPINAQPFAYITTYPLVIYNDSGPSVMRFNLADNTLTGVVSGADFPKANGVAITTDGSRAVVAAGNYLLVIDVKTNKLTANIRLGSIADDNDVVVASDGQFAYATGPTSGTIWVINLDTRAVTSINVGGKPAKIAVAPDNSRVYVSGCGVSARSLCIIDTTTNTVANMININYSTQFVISPDGKNIYLVGATGLEVISTATNVKTANINLGGFGNHVVITPDGKYAYVDTIGTMAAMWTSVIDLASAKVVATINAVGIMAVNPSGKNVHLFGLNNNSITDTIIDTATNTISDIVHSPPQFILFDVLFLHQIAIAPGPRQQPTFSVAGVVNAASYQGSGVAPGEIVTIFGSAIGPPTLTTMRLTSSGLVDNLLADTRVLFDGVPAPLVYVSQNQNSVIVPYAVAGKSTTQVQVEYKGLKSKPVTLRVVSAAPGIFTLNSSGKGQGAVLNENMTINSGSNPALRGSIVVLYATGEGQTSPPGVDGKVASSVFPKPLLPVSVQIGGVPAEVLYAGAAPGLVAGVLQINVRVPLNEYLTINPDNTVWVGFTVGNASSQPGVTIAVR